MAKRIVSNEDSDHYGYNDSNTSISGNIDGSPLYASDIIATRKKKIKKPKLVRKKSKRK